MALRRWFALGLWLTATVTATALVWAATSTVAADLTDRPPPLVAHRDVVGALQSGTAGADTAPGVTSAVRKSTPSTVSAPSPAAGSAVPAAGAVSGPPAPASVTTTTSGVTPPTTRAPSPPAAVPGRSTATFSTAGGRATVACTGSFFIGLVSATPAAGWTTVLVNGGPYYVEVHFTRAGAEQALWAFCLGNPVLAYAGPSVPGKVLAPG